MTHKTYKRDRKYTTILGVQVNSTELAEVLTWVEGWIAKKERFFVVTPNPEIVMLAQHDTVLARILNRADISLPDGIGLVWASRWLALRSRLSFARRANSPLAKGEIGPRDLRVVLRADYNSLGPGSNSAGSQIPNIPRALDERVSGIDVMEGLIELASKRGWRVFLLGGRPGIAALAAKKLKNELEIRNLKLEIQADPGLRLNAEGKPVNKKEEIHEIEVIKKISLFKPHLLFVGFGAPKQEKWVASNYNKLQTLGTMVVGGAFDYISGRIPRAPAWLRNMGLEWLFRLIIEPWRWKRQFALLRFAWAVLNSH